MRNEDEKGERILDPRLCDLSICSKNPTVKRRGKNEPVIVAKIWEDEWIAVKCQSNTELAGYLRKL